MTQILVFIGIVLGAYLLGSVPFGLIIVRLKTGKDVRQVESGRTGGTNAMRAAGFWAGLSTAILDISKSAVTVWVARLALPEAYWLHILAPLAAIVGHNYSIFLLERNETGRLRLRGGAGGAPAFGGALALWWPIVLFLVPIGALLFFIVGFASLTTLSIGMVTLIVFAYRAAIGVAPWQHVLYGVIAEALLIWALRPNIRRLLQGNERRVGIFARKSNQRPPQQNSRNSKTEGNRNIIAS